MKKLIVIGLALLIGGGLTARAADAKAIWDKECAKCHGADGKGKTKMGEKLGAKDYSDPNVQSKLTDEQLIKGIKEGVKEGGKTKMKGFSDLSDQEVKDLAAYMRAFKK